MDWSEIKEKVEQKDGVWTTTAAVLRNAAGYDRLGKNVTKKISSKLAQEGLGHVPTKLPRHGTAPVRLYLRGTDAGNFIAKAVAPSEENDQQIRDLVSGEEAELAETIEEIRQLVCE